MTQARASLEDVRRLVALTWRPGDVFELRGLAKQNGQRHVTFGFFDDPEAFAAAAIEQSGKVSGVYFTMNPTNPALLARAKKNALRRAGDGDTTSDKDVPRRRSLLVDVDAVRPAGISATDAEHGAAIALVRRIRDELAADGWPTPLFGDSGNGGHLLYAIDLPAKDDGLVERVLKRLQARFGCEVDGVTLKVDTSVHNPARISKIYGTLTKKGEDTPERPHRLARILESPAELAAIPTATLEAFAPIAKPAKSSSAASLRPSNSPPRTDRPAFELETWIAQHLPDAKERSWTSGRKWLLPVCPFNEEHNHSEAFIVQFPSGAVEAKCQHESCFKSWEQLRVKFEPDAYAYKNGNGHANGPRLTDREPPPEMSRDAGDVLFEDPRFANEIKRAEASPPDADVDTFADRDREAAHTDTTTAGAPPARASVPWKRGRELVQCIRDRMKDPWVSLTLVDDMLVRARVGATIVLIGGTGQGKTSLALCLGMEHVVKVGPLIVASIELPDEEFAARIVGQKCDASWEDALTGKVADADMVRVLDHPRLFGLSRDDATIKNIEAAIEQAKADYPGQPILLLVDYAQILEIESTEREIRQRVTDVFKILDRLARKHRVLVLALSQMSRASTDKARGGHALGAETTGLGAETGAIERYATATIAIGLSAPRQDGSDAVDISVGKGRMGHGDRVWPATFWGRSGLWRIAGEAKTAGEVREKREVEAEHKAKLSVRLKIIGAAASSPRPISRNQLIDLVAGERIGRIKISKPTALREINALVTEGLDKWKKNERCELVEIAERAKGSHKTKPAWLLWTEDRARAAGSPLVLESSLPGMGA